MAQRLRDDPHVWASALYDEVRALGYEQSYVTFAREVLRRRMRPRCEACVSRRGHGSTIEIEHEPGEEIQWDWVELTGAPWGSDKGLLLNGTLSYSGRTRGGIAEKDDQPHLIEAIDGVLRRLGGTPRRWRFDRMATVVDRQGGLLAVRLAGRSVTRLTRSAPVPKATTKCLRASRVPADPPAAGPRPSSGCAAGSR